MIHPGEEPPKDLRAVAATAAHASGARRVILFGSRARGDHDPDSDVDLLLLFDDETDLMEAALKANLAVFPRFWSLDVVPMTEDRYERRASILAIEAAREGVVLYG